MDAVDNLRLVWVHRWLVLGLSLLAAVVVGALVLVLPPTYSSTAIIRVVPPTGTLDVQALNTAVSWYVSLGQVPSVLTNAGDALTPPLTAGQVATRTELGSGDGPGEVLVVATGGDPDSTQALAAGMSQSVLAAVTADPELKIGNTTLQLLVPASTPGRSGPGAVPLAAAAFFLALAALVTLLALAGRRVDWRLSPAAAEELGEHLGVPTFRVASTPMSAGSGTLSAAAVLGPVTVDRSLAVMALGGGREAVLAAAVLAEGLARVGLPMRVADPAAARPESDPAVYPIASPPGGGIAAATALGRPVALAFTRARSRGVTRRIEDLRALELEVAALLVIGADRAGRRELRAARTTGEARTADGTMSPSG